MAEKNYESKLIKKLDLNDEDFANINFFKIDCDYEERKGFLKINYKYKEENVKLTIDYIFGQSACGLGEEKYRLKIAFKINDETLLCDICHFDDNEKQICGLGIKIFQNIINTKKYIFNFLNNNDYYYVDFIKELFYSK